MLADPFVATSDWTTITVDASENWSFPATERDAVHSLYSTALESNDLPGTASIFVGHQYTGRRNRYTFRITADTIIPDVLLDGKSSRVNQSCYVVFDTPPTGAFDYPNYSSGLHLPQQMMKVVGATLISVDSADPLFMRILHGET